METLTSLDLTADQARAMFPRVIGLITGATQITDRVVIVHQGPGAFSVLVAGVFMACCPSLRDAMRRAAVVTP